MFLYIYKAKGPHLFLNIKKRIPALSPPKPMHLIQLWTTRHNSHGGLVIHWRPPMFTHVQSLPFPSFNNIIITNTLFNWQLRCLIPTCFIPPSNPTKSFKDRSFTTWLFSFSLLYFTIFSPNGYLSCNPRIKSSKVYLYLVGHMIRVSKRSP